ncbi:hypothetical protein GCM10027167_51200 [Nocardia heshunensis]
MDRRATSAADPVSVVISHDALTRCIHDPMLDAIDAIHNARKVLMRKGVHGDVAAAEGVLIRESVRACPVIGALVREEPKHLRRSWNCLKSAQRSGPGAQY